jgi:hypothetical protein
MRTDVFLVQFHLLPVVGIGLKSPCFLKLVNASKHFGTWHVLSEPSPYFNGLCIDLTHKMNLMRPFKIVVLVDTQCVYPEIDRLPMSSSSLQEVQEVSSNVVKLPIHEDTAAAYFFCAPLIGKTRVFRIVDFRVVHGTLHRTRFPGYNLYQAYRVGAMIEWRVLELRRRER